MAGKITDMRLVIVSNRLPFTVSLQEGQLQFKPSAGGLTTGLWSYLDQKFLRAQKAGLFVFVDGSAGHDCTRAGDNRAGIRRATSQIHPGFVREDSRNAGFAKNYRDCGDNLNLAYGNN
jgi:trehalose-6-phosphate synthase